MFRPHPASTPPPPTPLPNEARFNWLLCNVAAAKPIVFSYRRDKDNLQFHQRVSIPGPSCTQQPVSSPSSHPANSPPRQHRLPCACKVLENRDQKSELLWLLPVAGAGSRSIIILMFESTGRHGNGMGGGLLVGGGVVVTWLMERGKFV